MLKTKESRKKFALFLFSFFLGFFLFSTPLLVSGKNTIDDADSFLTKTVAPTGVRTEDLSTRVGSIIQGAFRLVGLAFLVLMVYGGFRWMTARGNEADVEKAKETIIAAIIGLMIVVGAYALTNFIANRLILGQTGPEGKIGTGIEEEPNAPEGCCEFKVNEIPTWTAFMMTENACRASCQESLGNDCDTSDWKWDQGANAATCEVRRQDGLR